jgi:glycosyltransferase involved in cell wall biosynthesis
MYDLVKTEERSLRPEIRTNLTRLHRIALVGNFPPRRCGIATFTSDLRDAILSAQPSLICDVVAISDPLGDLPYPDTVTRLVRQDVLSDYVDAARAMNDDGVELACVQHEYGIFGGAAGDHLLAMLQTLACPIVTTLHTILEKPNDDQERVLQALIRRSSRLVVMSEKGREILLRRYGAPARKIEIVPHGAPDYPLVDSSEFKPRFGLAGHEVLLTFGLLSANKGLETVIRALPRITRERPDALYVVLGATHPSLVAREGEAYRESLEALARELGVADNVRFVNSYVGADELREYLAAADVYVTPYLHESQITSGTLSHAVALGKAVVSTPYWHAQELLADGAGVLVPFGDSEAMGEAVSKLLADEAARQALCGRAYAKGRATVWPRVGERYVRSFEAARTEQRQRPVRRLSTPAPTLRAVERMSDHCGILQHARFSIPDRHHGYCVDDNARALILMHRAHDVGLRAPHMDRLTHIYAAFVDHAWNEDAGRFRNFMSYGRQWLEQIGSEDSCGRAFWSVGETALLAQDEELRRWALDLAYRITPHVAHWAPLRTKAFAALALLALCKARPEEALFRDALSEAAHRLMAALAENRAPNWTWFEPSLSYDNARLPEALLRAAAVLERPDMRQAGLETLTWLSLIHTAPSGYFRPVGTQSFGRVHEKPAPFDQQPLEAVAAVDAAWAAYEATDDQFWVGEAQRAYAWYLGDNDLSTRMASADMAGCHDGLGPHEINRNQGAESILSFQLATCAMRRRERMRRPKSF